HVDRQVLFLLEQPQQQLVEAAVEVPVDVAHVVAERVVAVVGELDAGAGLARAPLGADAPGEQLLRHQVEVLELLQELVAEEAVPVRESSFGHYLVSGTLSRISATTASVATPSASPSKLRIRRWRSAGAATLRMSSTATA